MNLLKYSLCPFLFLAISLSCFSQTINGWTNMSGASIYVDNGMLAVEKVGGGQFGVRKQASAPLKVNASYEFTAVIDKGDCNSSSSIEARVVDASGAVIVSEVFSASGQHNLLSTFTVPVAGVYFMEFERIGNNSPCTFYINKIKLVETETITEICTVPVGEYRYGFNGMEKDDEVKGSGNSYDYGARMYDSRLGRFLSIDGNTYDYPGVSPYTYVANKPIIFTDSDGNVIRDSKGRKVKIKFTENGEIASIKTKDEKLKMLILNTWDNSEKGKETIRKLNSREVKAKVTIYSGRVIWKSSDADGGNYGEVIGLSYGVKVGGKEKYEIDIINYNDMPSGEISDKDLESLTILDHQGKEINVASLSKEEREKIVSDVNSRKGAETHTGHQKSLDALGEEDATLYEEVIMKSYEGDPETRTSDILIYETANASGQANAANQDQESRSIAGETAAKKAVIEAYRQRQKKAKTENGN